MTVHTDPWLPQCAAVSIQHAEMRMPPQKPELFITTAHWCVKSQATACWPPIIFGGA